MVLIDFFCCCFIVPKLPVGANDCIFFFKKVLPWQSSMKVLLLIFFKHFSSHCKHVYFLCCAQCTIFLLAGSCSQTCGDEGKPASSNQFFINVRAKSMHADRSHSLAYACMRECVHTRTHTHMRQAALNLWPASLSYVV